MERIAVDLDPATRDFQEIMIIPSITNAWTWIKLLNA